MTQDEITDMVRQSGNFSPTFEFLETFAKLVAEKAFNNGYAIGEARGFKEGVKLERKAKGEA